MSVAIPSPIANQPCKSFESAAIVCKNIKTLVKVATVLSEAAKVAQKDGSNIFCSAATLASGITSLCNGDLTTGITYAGVGAKQLYNIFKNDSSQIKDLLKSANAGVDMVKILEAENKQSFAFIKDGLDKIGEDVKELTGKIKAIEDIATRGQDKLIAQKEKALQLYQECNKSFDDAERTLHASDIKIDEANKRFSKALTGFDKLYKIANEHYKDPQKQLELFSKTVQAIHKECLEAQAILQQGQTDLIVGMAYLNHANKINVQAAEEAGRAFQLAESTLLAIQAGAKIEKNYQAQVDEVKAEIATVEQRNDDKEKLLDDISNDLTEAEKLIEKTFDTISILFGAVPGALIGNHFGPLFALAGGYAGAEIVSRRDELARKVGDAVCGFKVEEETQEEITNKSAVSFKFDRRSSGIWGRYFTRRTQSWTSGTIRINLGNETFKCSFNLNHKDKIRKVDLLALRKRMTEGLRAGTVTPQRCLEIIKHLMTVEIDRGHSHKPVMGFIARNCPFLMELMRACNKMMTNLKK